MLSPCGGYRVRRVPQQHAAPRGPAAIRAVTHHVDGPQEPLVRLVDEGAHRRQGRSRMVVVVVVVVGCEARSHVAPHRLAVGTRGAAARAAAGVRACHEGADVAGGAGRFVVRGQQEAAAGEVEGRGFKVDLGAVGRREWEGGKGVGHPGVDLTAGRADVMVACE